MQTALDQAMLAAKAGEVPVGCVIVNGRLVVAAAHNLVITHGDPTAHAEMEAIRLACKAVASPYLEGCDIYVTLEPCMMCAAAISRARLRGLYFGAYDSKEGAVAHGFEAYVVGGRLNHRPTVVGGVMEGRCAALLNGLFGDRRRRKRQP